MSKKALLDKRATLVKEADGLFAAANENGGRYTPEAAERDDAIIVEL